MISINEIKQYYSKINLEYILYGLREFRKDFLPFQVSATVTLAMMYSPTGSFAGEPRSPIKPILSKLVELATSLVLDDGYESRVHKSDKNDIYHYLVKNMTNQLMTDVDIYGSFARALLLYKKIPEDLIARGENIMNLPKFYSQYNKYTIEDFVSVCFVVYAATARSGIFTDEYFKVAKDDFTLPSQKVINNILNNISATPNIFNHLSEELISMENVPCSVLPLIQYPILRPWISQKKKGFQKRYIAPLPHLIANMAHSSIYYTFLTKYKKKFTDDFGKVFEYYVGEIIKNSKINEKIYDGITIQKWFSRRQGIKMPDWIVEDKKRVIIFECKAARIPRPAQARGSNEDFKTTFKKINIAVTQIQEFVEVCQREGQIKFDEYKGVIVTYDNLMMDFFSEFIASDYLDKEEKEKFVKGMENIIILSAQQLEALQPHFSEDICLWDVISNLFSESYNDVLKKLVNKTGKTYVDCFLYKYDEQIFKNIDPKGLLRVNKDVSI